MQLKGEFKGLKAVAEDGSRTFCSCSWYFSMTLNTDRKRFNSNKVFLKDRFPGLKIFHKLETSASAGALPLQSFGQKQRQKQ